MSGTPIKDAIDKLGASGDGLEFTAGSEAGQAGAAVEATKTVGTWSVSAAAAWVKGKGASVLGKIKWTPK